MTDYSDPAGPGSAGSGSFDDFLARLGEGAGAPPGAHRMDITRLMTQQAQEMLGAAVRLATEHGSIDLHTAHLLLSAARTETTRGLLERAGADPDELARHIESQLPHAGTSEQAPALTPAAKRALLDAHQIAHAVGASYIGPEHVLFALAVNAESSAARLLAERNVTPQSLQAAAARQQPATAAGARATGTPTIDRFGTDLTARAREGNVDPVVGRDDEIEQAIEVLSRRTKNNPVLIGEAGVGKTAVVEGIAQRIADAEAPDVLSGKRVVQLDMAGLVAGTRYRGDFEERMTKLLDEISEHRDELVIFIDELHTVVGTTGSTEGSVDAANMLKPKLARGELHVIGATTLDEYRTRIEKDAALERRFQPVLVAEPSVEDTVQIMFALRDRYEAHHQVRFSDEAIIAAAELSDRYITDRYLPDKAIDLIDQAGARKRLRSATPATDVFELERRLEQLERDKAQAVADEQFERATELRDEIAELREVVEKQRQGQHSGAPAVTADDIAEVVSRATGIPVTQLTEEEKARLMRLEEHLHQRVVGQGEAVHAVARAVRRARTGLSDPNRPMGTFLFLGPTGVGKTELARALAEALFGNEDRMVRLDMSEFQEGHTASRMVGAPPGYVGYGEAGQLTETVRRRPYSVVLLDEIEKAHPDVFNVLLQVLEDGRLTDGQGRTVDFKNTVLIMTSNLGSDIISQRSGVLGFSTREDEQADEVSRDRVMARLQESFRPEFLNRIDEIIIFRELTVDQLRQITELLLDETRRRLRAQGIDIGFTPQAVDWITERGYKPEFGARPLRRTIQREIDDVLSALLLEGRLSRGQRVEVGTEDGRLSFSVRDG